MSEIEYLNMVIQETMRMSSIVGRIKRVCNNSTDINGIRIPKGSFVSLSIYSLHSDPNIWQDPEKFDPMRCSPHEKFNSY